jgi:hypothetical protein
VTRSTLAVLLAAAALLAGCGGDERPTTGASPGDAPAITSPGTGSEYENGGADGSGADGTEEASDRGGIAAGPDTPAPGDRPGADVP